MSLKAYYYEYLLMLLRLFISLIRLLGFLRLVAHFAFGFTWNAPELVADCKSLADSRAPAIWHLTCRLCRQPADLCLGL